MVPAVDYDEYGTTVSVVHVISTIPTIWYHHTIPDSSPKHLAVADKRNYRSGVVNMR